MRAITSWALLWALLSLAFRDTECIAKELPRGPGAALPQSPRIAIIGAGAGGSSAAFWIAKAKERYGLDVVVDIFERSDYVGGRKLFNSCDSLQLWLTSLKEALQFIRIMTQPMCPWNLAHPSL